jgi:hypothetical protein
VSGKTTPAIRRTDPHLGQAHLKGQVLPVPGYLVGYRGGQHRGIADDRDLDPRQPLRPPPQAPAGIADDVILIAEHLAAKGGPLQAGMHQYAQCHLVAGRECRGTTQGRFGYLVFRRSVTCGQAHRDTS